MVKYASRLATFAVAVLALTGCKAAKREASTTFYQREIGPILQQSCANSPTQSGCHVAADTHGNAFGNLNVTSYDSLTKRRDLLISYGPYLLPGILAKVLPPFQVRLTTWQGGDPIIVTTDIPHAGGSLIDLTSSSFDALSTWISRGASENNSVVPAPDLGRTPCPTNPGTDNDFDPTVDPTAPDYAIFAQSVNKVLGTTCAAGNCHGSPTNSMYLTCGTSPEQTRWNYFAAGDYVSTDPVSSELLRRTVAISAGGTYHEGGTLFKSMDDPGYVAILAWAKAKGGPGAVPTDAGFPYFTDHVQPMLVKKGCMLLGCHSPAMGHEYRLRSGSGGHFSLPETRHNYELSLAQVSLDSPDPNASRILRKNLVPFIDDSPVPQTPEGILHRGGALFGAGDPCTDTDALENGDLDSQLPYCVIRHWIELERQNRMGSAAALSSIVYVKRPLAPGPDAAQDFEAFSGGADLIQAPATLDATGNLSVQGGTSLLGSCGLSAGIDVRRPAVSWDGKRIAFSARASESDPWRIYVVGGGSCAVEPTIDAPPTDDSGREIPTNGELVHNFDPTFAPDGRLVFTSTRGNVTNAASFDYQGPQRTPADPSRLNANLYVVEDTSIRQLTFLLNQELTPSFMSDGRLMMTTEKRANGFYQLAGRRENLDGGDYHPLFGQRATFGYRQVTDISELPDKNLVAIFSDAGAAHGAGALGIVNRSLGVDQQSTDANDYLVDKGALSWPNPKFYQHQLRIVDGNGRIGTAGGVYRNPTRLPNGKVLVSYAPDVADITSFDTPFALVVVNPVSGERSAPVVSDSASVLWPVAVYERYSYGVYKSKLDEPNGATQISSAAGDKTRSDITFLDVPLFESLLFQNTRSKRVVPDKPSDLQFWEDLPPESGVKSYDDGGAFVVSDAFGKVYVRRRMLGSATPLDDFSMHVRIPGGAPLVLAPNVQLAADGAPVRHHQLEEMQFYPGEIVRQGFQRHLFNGVCANCHGAVSGYDADISANPDILTQASRVSAKDAAPTDVTNRGAAQKGPFP
ncbi:MAG TPA: hypothetical protein VH062_36370 [Polyangiaceae bacterium]|nr:hypothetical protein [Polyangiaceae bacterium]